MKCWVSGFKKIFKNEDFGFEILKLIIFLNFFNGIICAYKEFYLPFFRRNKGGGGESPFPGPENSVVLRGLRRLYITRAVKNLFPFARKSPIYFMSATV